MSNSNSNINVNNTESYISESRHHKKEFIALSNGYSNHLQKGLEGFINSSEDGIDKELVNKITQIHKDKAKIETQHGKLKLIHAKMLKVKDNLESDLYHSKRYLIKNKLIRIDSHDPEGGIINLVQRKSELIDQDIRILENCVRLLQENKNSR